MDGSTIELARRAVACKAWRWMLGMGVLEGAYGYAPARLCWYDSKHDKWHAATHDGAWLRYNTNAQAMLIPDLTDPATIGCVLDLLRRAWEPRLPTAWSIHVRPVAQTLERPAGWELAGLDVGGGGWIYESEAAALVDALEGAP